MNHGFYNEHRTSSSSWVISCRCGASFERPLQLQAINALQGHVASAARSHAMRCKLCGRINCPNPFHAYED